MACAVAGVVVYLGCFFGGDLGGPSPVDSAHAAALSAQDDAGSGEAPPAAPEVDIEGIEELKLASPEEEDSEAEVDESDEPDAGQSDELPLAGNDSSDGSDEDAADSEKDKADADKDAATSDEDTAGSAEYSDTNADDADSAGSPGAGSPSRGKTEPSGTETDGEESEADGQRRGEQAETPPRQLTQRQLALKQQLEQCLGFYYRSKPLNTRDDSAWSVMHSFLGLGATTPVAVGSPQGQRANAIAWMCSNRPCGGRQLLYVQNGLVLGREGPGFQGHPAQFLAMLAQVHVSPEYELRVNNQQLTVQDLIDAEKLTCREGMELTFKLISFSHYLPSTATWRDRQGQEWDIPRLIRYEIRQPINGAACGGTHRLMGLSCAVYNRHEEGAPMDGQWARAAKYIRDYHRYTYTLQNQDGSFSSDWFKRRAQWGGIDRKLQTTGHITEWLTYSLPDDELDDPRLVRAVQLLVNLMIANRHYDWEVGPRGHALRALRLYHERALGGRPSDWTETPAVQRSARAAR